MNREFPNTILNNIQTGLKIERLLFEQLMELQTSIEMKINRKKGYIFWNILTAQWNFVHQLQTWIFLKLKTVRDMKHELSG